MQLINTERLYLEPISEKDTAFVLELLNTADWIRFIGERNVHSVLDAISYIRKIRENPCIHYWTVRIQEGEVPAGLLAIIKRDYLDHPDLGFAFLPAFYGKGYAYEAACAVMNTVAEDRLLAITLPGNHSSIRLIEKLGFIFVSEIDQNDETLLMYAREQPTAAKSKDRVQ